jgi:hypothetical protein
MKKGLIFLLVIVGGGYLLWAQPWKPHRYNDTPEGKEAKRIDDHVQQAVDWHDSTQASWWPAKDYIGPKAEKGRSFGDMGWAEANKFTDDLLQAGATGVYFINIKRSVRSGDAPEGLVAVLPDAPAARASVFAAFGKQLSAQGKSAPKDVNQKYLYMGFGTWTPTADEPGFLPS